MACLQLPYNIVQFFDALTHHSLDHYYLDTTFKSCVKPQIHQQ